MSDTSYLNPTADINGYDINGDPVNDWELVGLSGVTIVLYVPADIEVLEVPR